MKRIILISLLSISFISCENSTGFSQGFKDNFIDECIKTAVNSVSQSQAESYCNCGLGLVMEKYRSGVDAERKILDMSYTEVVNFFEPCGYSK